MREFERIFWIVLDSVGIGQLPDAADYGDVGRNTLGHIAESRPLQIPNLVQLGLANTAPLKYQTPAAAPLGSYGKGATHSHGKDTTTGHWEMAGVWLDQAFPVYKDGFPKELIEEFEKQIGRKTIGNKPASGTEIIKELGEEHVRTGKPIVYTSGDSVFQIATHEEVIPIAELYRMCEVARKLGVLGVGKIHDIYNGRGVEEYVSTKGNVDGMEKMTAAASARKTGLIFCNLVDFDMLYGHRKDVAGFAKSLEEFDVMLGEFLPLLSFSDMLMITADHGCDPDPRWPTTDHSREYVPILAYSPGGGAGVDLGVRDTLADMGQTIAENFGATIPHGRSFLSELKKQRSNEVAG